MPATVFVTAYDRYAVEAFELAAADYLVKPFDDDRFALAMQRVRRVLALGEMDRLRARMLALLQGGGAPHSSAAPHTPFLRRIAVESRGIIRSVPADRIDYIAASGPYAELHAAGHRHLLRQTMHALEHQLDPREFMRVHRSVIVRLERVESLRRGESGDGWVVLHDGKRLRVSRTRREALERWLGIAP